MRHQILRYALSLFFALGMCEFVLGQQSSSPKKLFTYKDKQYTVEDMTGVSDKTVSAIIGKLNSKYDIRKYQRLDEGYLLPALAFWEPTGDVTLRDYYQHHYQGLVERFIQFEVFKHYKKRYPVNIKRYYRAELVEEAIRCQAELRDRWHKVILSALDEKTSEAEIIESVKRIFPESRYKDQVWTRIIKSFRAHQPYYTLNHQCFPWMVGGKPAPWVKHTCYSSLIKFHIQAEIERNKEKYIRMLEDDFGRRNYFVIKNAQDSDKQQLLKLINRVTDRKGKIAGGGVETINKTLRALKSPTRMELQFGAKLSIAHAHKLSEDRIKPRQFISLGKSGEGMESYLYIFQEEPTPYFKDYSSAPGNFLYGTGMKVLVRPLIEEVKASIKPAKGVTIRSTDQIIYFMNNVILFDELYGVSLPKVLLKQ